jgi:hypothetical protein
MMAAGPEELHGPEERRGNAGRRAAASRRIGGVLVCGFLPGALVGAHLAGLLFFLNPALPWRVWPVARAMVWYAGELGLFSLAAHLPLFVGARWRQAPRLLPWTLTAALALAAILDGAQASHYAYYLPTGINERLIKTAIWLAVAAVLCFYTALLHSLGRRRAYGIRSRLFVGLLATLSVLVMIERRAAFHPRPALPPRSAVVERVPRPRVWMVGLETATLDAILPLANQGELPFLAEVLKHGAYGRLESFSPVRPEALWITLACGKYPWQHGVAGGTLYSAPRIGRGAELRLLPAGIAFGRWGLPAARSRLLHGYGRQALAIWEILPRLGIPSGIVGWPASSPVSTEATFALSDRYFTHRPEPSNASSPELGLWARSFRPAAGSAAPPKGSPAAAASGPQTMEALAPDAWDEAVAGALLDHHPEVGGFFAVLPGLSEVSRRYFGGFTEVEFRGVQSPEALLASHLIAAYYRHLDDFLARLWKRHTGDDILVVVSASGIEGSEGWRRVWAELSSQGSLEGFETAAPDGVLMLYGEGIQQGALLTGAQLVDVLPTLMYALHLPVARDLDGVVLTPAFDKGFLASHPLTFLPTYESLRPALEPPKK